MYEQFINEYNIFLFLFILIWRPDISIFELHPLNYLNGLQFNLKIIYKMSLWYMSCILFMQMTNVYFVGDS